MSNLLEQASLVMIPSGYKEDVVYSEIPLDGSGDLSFTRASNGTRVNFDGLVEDCPWNLVQNSENFSAIWINQNSTITTNSLVAPNGTTTADSLIAANGVNFYSGVYVTDNTDVVKTISCYVKKGSKRWVLLLGYSGNSNCWFDLDNGVVGTRGSNFSASSITSVGNGWFRIDAVMNDSTGGSNNIGVYAADADNSNTCTGDGTTVSSYIWGYQCNIGSTAKPYFPTTDRLNVPRLPYQNGGGGCPSLLLEKQSTNLALYSEQFDDASWTKGDVTVTANSTTSPDGTTNADTINLGAGGFANIRQFIAVANDTSYTVSCYYKNIALTAGQTFEMRYTNELSAPNNFNAITTIDLFNGTVTSQVFGTIGTGYSGSVSSSITNVGNGWYRVTMTFTVGSSGGANGIFRPAVIPTGQARTFYAWGAQLELGAYPTSYIPTTSASATRVADACFKTGISSLIGQTEGVVFFDFTVDTISAQTNNPVLWYMKDGGAGERYFELYSNGNLEYVEFDGTTVIASIIKTGLTVGRHKCAIGYANNDMVLYVDGVRIGTDVSGTPNGFSTFSLQYYNTVFNGQQKVNQAALFKTRLTNAELASLTTI
jgi:hypothetical protein